MHPTLESFVDPPTQTMRKRLGWRWKNFAFGGLLQRCPAKGVIHVSALSILHDASRARRSFHIGAIGVVSGPF
jgi:hypothetical protein